MFKKALIIFILILLALTFSAAAEPAVPQYVYWNEADIIPMMPPGLEYAANYDSTTGTLRITIDTANTDWELVSTAGLLPDAGTLVFRVRAMITPGMFPEGATLLSVSTGGTDDSELPSIIAQFGEELWDTSMTENGYQFADYNEDDALLLPRTNEDFTQLVWDAATPSLVYRLNISFDFTDSEPFHASPNLLPAEYISADVSATESGIDTVVEDGYVSYTYWGSGKMKDMITKLYIPEMQGHLSDRKLSWYFLGDEYALDCGQDAHGVYHMVFTDTWSDKPQVTTNSMNILVRDENDIVLNCYTLRTIMQQGKRVLWPETADPADPDAFPFLPFEPVPAERLRLSISACDSEGNELSSVSGIDYSYENNIVTMQVDNELLPDMRGVDFESIALKTRVIPPAGAKYVQYFHSGGTSIYSGTGGGFNIPPTPDGYEFHEITDGKGYDYDEHYFIGVRYAEGVRTIFKGANDYPDGLGGAMPIIYWFDENKTPFLAEYFGVVEDPVRLRYSTNVVQSEDQISEDDQDKPVIMNPTGAWNGFYLNTIVYPTGENRYYYELTLRTGSNKVFTLNGRCYLYIPYPPLSDIDQLSFTIEHYSPDGSTLRETFDESKIVRTPFGLRIEIGSLSPFTLSWSKAEESEPTPTPTPTPAPTPIPIQIITQPADQYVSEGQSAQFSISISGGTAAYQWYIDRNDGSGWKKIEGAVGASYTTSPTELRNNGYKYYCAVTDEYGGTINSDTATLYVVKFSEPPKTGDRSLPALWLALLIAGTAGLTMFLSKRMKSF